MSDTVEYRPGVPDDALCIGVLAMHVFLDTYASNGLRPDLAREVLTVYSTLAFSRRLHDATTHFVVAEANGHLVAFVEMCFGRPCPVPHGAQVEIVRLYVQRSFQRRGIGLALAQCAERIAEQQGNSAIWLSAWAGNTNALAYYPAIGYQDVGSSTYAIEDQSYENRVFAKRLLPYWADAPLEVS